MSKQEEQISSLMDGELSGKEATRTLEWMNTSPEARETWTRYHLARHLLRDDPYPPAFDAGFAERVSRTIEAEPLGLPRSRKRSFREGPALRWALAASLTAVVVLATRELEFSGGEPGERLPAVASNPELSREAELHAEAEERLRAYLTMHNESIQIIGNDDTFGRTRVVSYSP
jgi:sigma-E factor negative regulatory protein RseA